MTENFKIEFIRVIEGYNHLWAVKFPGKEDDELTDIFTKWRDIEYLLKFFTDNLQDLKNYFHIERISTAIKDTIDDAEALEQIILELPYYDNFNELFRPLGSFDKYSSDLMRTKARWWDREYHPCWLRIYAIRLDKDLYVVTGGAIKLTRTMQEREHTAYELKKLNACVEFLKQSGVFDKDSFVELTNE